MNDMLSYAEAANLLGVPKGTLYSWVSQKRVPHLRYGGRLVRFSRRELESWQRQCSVAAEPTSPKTPDASLSTSTELPLFLDKE